MGGECSVSNSEFGIRNSEFPHRPEPNFEFRISNFGFPPTTRDAICETGARSSEVPGILSGSVRTEQHLEATDTLPRVIKLKNVTKRYPGADIDILAGIDLTIEAGDFVSIVGRSGSGKTTLLNLVGGLDRSYDGAIEVDGRDLRSFGDSEVSEFRNRTVGHVFQAYHLLDHLTCSENVAVAALFVRGQMRADRQREPHQRRSPGDCRFGRCGGSHAVDPFGR